MAFGNTWDDAFELLPADDGLISIGAGQIRTLKDAISERMQIDHEFATSGAGTDTGYHKKVTLKVATPGTPSAGYVELGSAADALYFKGSGGTLRTVVTLDGSQTLTNKTLTAPTITGVVGGTATSMTITTMTGNVVGALTGNAATASKWLTARNIVLSGDVNGITSIDGAANVSITATVVDDSHAHTSTTISGLAAGDITSNVTGSGNIVKATSPTITTPSVSNATNVIGVHSIEDQESKVTPIQIHVYESTTWDMDTVGSINIAHGLPSYAKFLGATASIMNDAGTTRTGFTDNGGGLIQLDNTNIQLTRTAGGTFDNTNYNSTGISPRARILVFVYT